MSNRSLLSFLVKDNPDAVKRIQSKEDSLRKQAVERKQKIIKEAEEKKHMQEERKRLRDEKAKLMEERKFAREEAKKKKLEEAELKKKRKADRSVKLSPAKRKAARESGVGEPKKSPAKKRATKALNRREEVSVVEVEEIQPKRRRLMKKTVADRLGKESREKEAEKRQKHEDAIERKLSLELEAAQKVAALKPAALGPKRKKTGRVQAVVKKAHEQLKQKVTDAYPDEPVTISSPYFVKSPRNDVSEVKPEVRKCGRRKQIGVMHRSGVSSAAIGLPPQKALSQPSRKLPFGSSPTRKDVVAASQLSAPKAAVPSTPPGSKVVSKSTPSPAKGQPKKKRTPSKKTPKPEVSIPGLVFLDPSEIQTTAGGFQFGAVETAPPRAGEKSAPTGNETCLAGLTFVISGVLDSLERREAADLIMKCGGRVTGSPSGKTDFGLIGEEPGVSKLAKFVKNGTPLINEDGLFLMIRTLSNTLGEVKPDVSKPVAEEKVVKHDVSTIKADFKTGLVSPAKGATSSASSPSAELWTETYRPAHVGDLIGNGGAVNNLKTWLTNWRDVVLSGLEGDAPKGAGSKSGLGSSARAALLSGPPGIGKTSAALVVCNDVGFEAIEFNASDTRSKKSLQEIVKEATQSSTVTQFFGVKGASGVRAHKRRPCILMDEVDGMSSGDRGGMAELIKLISDTRVPIICMCNDRASPKVRSLANHCYDLPFRRPVMASVKGRFQAILSKEGVTLAPGVLDKVWEACSGDIRQLFNLIQMWAVNSKSGRIDFSQADQNLPGATKNIQMGPFDTVPKLFGSGAHASSIMDKQDMYFVDSMLVPLLVHEHYLNQEPAGCRSLVHKLHLAAEAADSISVSDKCSQFMRSTMSFSLMPTHAFFSTTLPSSIFAGRSQRRANFPAFLGKMSQKNKRLRLLQEISAHMAPHITGSRIDVAQDYFGALSGFLTQPMVDHGKDGVEQVIELLDYYGMSREDWDTVFELQTFEKQKDMRKKVPGRVRTHFTRRYNETHYESREVKTAAKKNRRKSK